MRGRPIDLWPAMRRSALPRRCALPRRSGAVVGRAILAVSAFIGSSGRLELLELPGFVATAGVEQVIDVLAPPACAAMRPSAELAFATEVSPDSVTIGDPIRVVLRGSAPDSGTLVTPSWSDTLGPFQVLAVVADTEERAEDRVSFTKELQVTAFDTGTLALPDLAVYWVVDGDTAVARAPRRTVVVQSVLPDSIDLSNPTTAIAELRDVKGVLSIGSVAWLRWVILAAAVLLVALAGWWGWRHRRKRPAVVVPAPVRAARRLPPEEAFETGLAKLFHAELLERGEVKEFYAGVSLLLREYLEGRFGVYAMEETREEILLHARESARLSDTDRAWLASWLLDADLVKFAKMTRALAEGRDFAEEARRWVRDTTQRSTRVTTDRGLPSAPSANGSGSRVATPSSVPPLPVAPTAGSADSGSAARADGPGGTQTRAPDRPGPEVPAEARGSRPTSAGIGGLGPLTPVVPPTRSYDEPAVDGSNGTREASE